MRMRRLGNSSLNASSIGLGLMSMSGTYGKSDDQECIGVIHRALDLGINHLDSSDMYGWGQNEELLGRAIKGKRDRVLVATKFGQVRSPDGKGNLVDGRPAYVAEACDASLKRLGVDVIDLYYQHRVDPKVPIEDTVGGMSRLIERGKVRFLGLSEAAPETVRRAQAVHPISAVQSEYSLLYRQPAEDTIATCREQDDRRRQHPRFQEGNLEHNLGLVRRIEEIAREKGATPSQLALAWLLAQGEDVFPIPGTKRRSYLEENVEALSINLTKEDLARINEAMPPGAAAGSRYPEAQMKGVNI
ncbi:MAG: aldo/keto reductase [Candidatus Rokuibacteriota bacterium]|nr:MAG: aldo/keto reductase [Candidatus Rokubacteria bacterium]